MNTNTCTVHGRSLVLLLLLAGTSLAGRAQLTITSGTYVSTSGATTLGVAADLSNAGTFAPGSATVYAGGNWTNTGTLTPGTSSVIFNGTGSQQVQGNDFYNLEVNKTSNDLALGSNVVVGNTLTLAGGMVNTGAYTLSLGTTGAITGETNGRYVAGTLRADRTVNAGTNTFGGMGLEVNAGSENLGLVTALRKAGTLTQGVSYAQSASGDKSIDRIWSVTPASQPAGPVSVTLNWISDDDNGYTDFTAARGWASSNGGTSWSPLGATADASSRTITLSVTHLSLVTVTATGSTLGAPEIDILGGSPLSSIASGSSAASATTGTLLAPLAAGATTQATFTIENSGVTDLTITGIQLSGTGAGFFQVVNPLPATIPAYNGVNGSATFTVRYTAVGAGARTCTVTVLNDDGDEGTYTFLLRGSSTPGTCN